MNRASKILLIISICLLVIGLFSFSTDPISPRLQKKIDTAIGSTYALETFILKRVEIADSLNRLTPIELGGNNLFEIRNRANTIGYLYLGEAPSMKRKFDYIVMFDPQLTIKKSKVLIYREDYGQQIGSQRWLKQFIGMSAEDTPVYTENIDAISGATISASSMTKAVANVLKSIPILKENKLIQ